MEAEFMENKMRWVLVVPWYGVEFHEIPGRMLKHVCEKVRNADTQVSYHEWTVSGSAETGARKGFFIWALGMDIRHLEWVLESPYMEKAKWLDVQEWAPDPDAV